MAKIRSQADLEQLKGIVKTMWLVSGYSIRKIASEINSTPDYVKRFGKVSDSSVAQWCKEVRREAETWLDEDALEKYTGEFVRQQNIYDNEIEKLEKAQSFIDYENGDSKEKEMYLKFANAIHNIRQDKIKLLTDIELVLRVKALNADRRKKYETLKLMDEKERKAKTGATRGYLTVKKVDEEDDKNMSEMSKDLSEEQSSQEMQGDD